MSLDASPIVPGLWQGSAPTSVADLRQHGIDLLVLCAVEIQPSDAALRGISFMRVPLTDDGRMPDAEWDLAFESGCVVAQLVREGHQVLVTCAMGRNRSGLVSAIALHVLTGKPGSTCVDWVQRRRPNALTNPAFVAALTARLL